MYVLKMFQKVTLRSRKSNLNNQPKATELRNNFLNRLDQAQHELNSLRETLIFALARGDALLGPKRSTPPGLMAPGEDDLDEDYDDDDDEAEGLLASLVLARPHLEQGQGR